MRWFVSAVLVSSVAFGVIAGAAQRGWSDDTHGRYAVPDYDRVFAQGEVKRLDIRVTADQWARLVADMADMSGTFGGDRAAFNTAPDPARTAACTGLVEGSLCSFGNPPQGGRCTQLPMGVGLSCTPLPGAGIPDGGFPGNPPGGTVPPGGNQGRGGQPGGGGGGNAPPAGNVGRDDVELLPRTPIYIPATVVFDGVAFHQVGLRLKGNSSLLNSWRSGVEKLPFRLNFDALEDEYPETRDQTFFGFPNLNLTNNSQDASFMRAKVVGDLFREFGVPAARTAFVRVFFDRGEGTNYLGVYTLVEVPDEPMLVTQFGSGDGNLYKPNGTGARWTVFDPESFPKKSNERDEDWTDVEDAITVLNESRASPEVWRVRLEARFGVVPFLKWLALNTVIGNTDTYGGFSPHNYYVYGSPRHRDRLFFIPWDHDLALNTGLGGAGGGGGAGGPGGGGFPSGAGGTGGGAAIDIFNNTVNASWPLIRFLLDDPVYRTAYRQYVEEALGSVFDPAQLTARLQAQRALVEPYVIGPEGEQPGRTFIDSPAEFAQATSSLLTYVQTRAVAARQALATGR